MADIFIPDTSELMQTTEEAYELTPSGTTMEQLTSDTKRSVDMFVYVSGVGNAVWSNTSEGTIKQILPAGTRMGLGRGHMLDSVYVAKSTVLDAVTVSVIGAAEDQP